MSAAFDSLALRAVVLELQDIVIGAQVQKIRQPDAFTVLLRLHGQGKSRWLLLSANPELFRAHLTTRDFQNPQEPPPFCMALRKYLEGGRVIAVRQDGADRILRVEVSSSWGRLQLVAELMGRHSNIVLLAENGTVLEAIKHVGGRLSRRLMLPGRPYPPLPASDKPSLWDAPREELDRLWDAAPSPLTKEWLLASFGGMSPALAARVLGAPDPRTALEDIVATIRAGRAPNALLDGTGSVSGALDAAYAQRAGASQQDALLRRVNAALDKEARVLAHRAADLDEIERKAQRAEEWRIAGELLSANAHAIPKGETAVSLPNYYAEGLAPMQITLDPTLTARENAEAHFERQRRARSAVERVPELRREIASRLADIAVRRARALEADEAGLAAMLPDAAEAGPAERHREPAYPPGVRIKRFTEDGWTILVGENATGNDYLTTRLADPGDIWLHVRAAASAHAAIRTNKHPERVPAAVLRRAAEMVAARSEARGSSVIAVDYTLRRYVRKPRGAAPGRVTYTNEKTIEVQT